MPLTRYTDPVLEQSSVIARKPAHEVQPRISSFSNVPEAHRFLEKILWPEELQRHGATRRDERDLIEWSGEQHESGGDGHVMRQCGT
jgi:hypothetical protein